MAQSERLYLYPVWLRIWHGINALAILLLILTGLSMHYASNMFLFSFRSAVAVHNIAGITLSVAYFLFFFGNMFTKNGRFYQIKMRGLGKRLKKQATFYLFGMFRGETCPYPVNEKRKFNPLQKYSYLAVMYLLVPAVIISGLGLLFPEIVLEDVYHVNGVMVTALFHSLVGFFILIFLMIHLYVATIGKSPVSNFRSIVTGWH